MDPNSGRVWSKLSAEPHRCPHCAEIERVRNDYQKASAMSKHPDFGIKIGLFEDGDDE